MNRNVLTFVVNFIDNKKIYQILLKNRILYKNNILYNNDIILYKKYTNHTPYILSGNLDEVKFNYKYKCLIEERLLYGALYSATYKGHLNILKWIYKNIPTFLEYLPYAIIHAAYKGYVDIIKWIFTKIRITPNSLYITRCADHAVKNNHVAVVLWFAQNTDIMICRLCINAAKYGHFDMVKHLAKSVYGKYHINYHINDDSCNNCISHFCYILAESAVCKGNVEMLKLIHRIDNIFLHAFYKEFRYKAKKYKQPKIESFLIEF